MTHVYYTLTIDTAVGKIDDASKVQKILRRFALVCKSQENAAKKLIKAMKIKKYERGITQGSTSTSKHPSLSHSRQSGPTAGSETNLRHTRPQNAGHHGILTT